LTVFVIISARNLNGNLTMRKGPATGQYARRERAPRGAGWLVALCLAATHGNVGAESQQGYESKPLRETVPDYSQELEDAHVSRLQNLLRSYHREQQEAADTQPTAEELDARVQASEAAAGLDRIPYNVNKVYLTGIEGSMALAEITRRLSDPSIPESRRDNSPVCAIRTYLFGNLIAGERRSFRPVGKHHYLLKHNLQPGTSTLSIAGHSWEVHIPEDTHSQAYLITLYKPPGTDPQFHVFPVADLLAADDPHIPAWLPNDLRIKRPG